MPFEGRSYTVNRAMYEVISYGCGYTGITKDEAVIFSVTVSGLLLWLVLLRAVADLFVVCILRRNN